MYLLYVDESGNLTSPEAEHAVLAGLAVHEVDARPLAREAEAIITRHLDSHLRHLELHAQHIRKGKGGWRGIPREVKAAIMADVAGLLASFPHTEPYALFGVVREPGAVAHAEPLTRVYEELALRFNSYVRKNRAQGVRQYGMFVADEAKYKRTVQILLDEWRHGGARFGPLTRIAEVPLFVDSDASRLVQLADFVAHFLYIAYEHGDDTYFNILKPAFQRRANGTLDGLVHLTASRTTCPCWPCAERRAEPLPGMP